MEKENSKPTLKDIREHVEMILEPQRRLESIAAFMAEVDSLLAQMRTPQQVGFYESQKNKNA